jgi:hypothetical protein
MSFDLDTLISVEVDLSSLVQPFTKEEIDRVIRTTPPDKAPGPDGFNGLFLKKCWHLIKVDYYKLCFDFIDCAVDLESINGSFITLVPKVNHPESVNDYRPISLLNGNLKTLTKLLAERLQLVILKILHANQYGFIRSRSIQDCLPWSFEYIHQCHRSKREIIILKLDFAKAFNTVEHGAILTVMKHMGFHDKWLKWTTMTLSSETSQVLLNGVPGKQFKCKRGARQGDLLSPLLFVLAAELLQFVVNDACQKGDLTIPIPQPCADFPIIQYADDTLLLMQADPDQLLCLKNLLCDFATSTNLKVNFHKSLIVPINVPDAKMATLAGLMECQIGTMPFTYLGLPTATTKPRMEDLAPILDQIERRLSAYLSCGA